MLDPDKITDFKEFFLDYSKKVIEDHKDDSLDEGQQMLAMLSEEMGFVSGALSALKAIHNRCAQENRLDFLMIVDEEIGKVQLIGDAIAAKGLAIAAKIMKGGYK